MSASRALKFWQSLSFIEQSAYLTANPTSVFNSIAATSGSGKTGEYWLAKNDYAIYCFQIKPNSAYILGMSGTSNYTDKETTVQEARELYKKLLSEGWKSFNPRSKGMTVRNLSQRIYD